MKKRIFIGYSNVAGVGSRLKEAFVKLNYKADFYSYGQHPFGYKSDKIIRLSRFRFLRTIELLRLTLYLALNYDYFIFISSSSLFRRRFDLKFFRILKKPLMIVYTGCDIRIPEKVKDLKWNPCGRCTIEYKKLVSCNIPSKERALELEKKLFDFITVPRELSSSMVSAHHFINWPIDLGNFKGFNYQKTGTNGKLKILHAPSNETYKGSNYIYEAINRLKIKYDFEFKVVKNIPIQELYMEIVSSDLIIDQIGGFYGLLSIEAMALGRPVITYIYDKIWEDIKSDCPIINANPKNLYYVLEEIILKPEQLNVIGTKSKAFVEKYHSDLVVATDLLQLFESFNLDY